jgi:hypothetical protein
MHELWENLCGLWELLRLALASGLRMRSSYWMWRYETAFGTNPTRQPSRWQRWKAMIRYGRWVHRMRRYTR